MKRQLIIFGLSGDFYQQVSQKRKRGGQAEGVIQYNVHVPALLYMYMDCFNFNYTWVHVYICCQIILSKTGYW